MPRIFSSTIFLCFIIVCTSCHKESRMQVSGTVTDDLNQQRLGGVKVQIRKFKPNAHSTWDWQAEVVAESVTNADGSFELDYRPDDRYDYGVRAEHSAYSTNGSNLIVITEANAGSQAITLHPYGHLQLHFINTQPYNSQDTFWYTINGVNSLSHYYGTTINTTTESQPVTGNDTVSVLWHYKKNYYTYHDSAKVYCPAYVTTTYTINF